MRIPFLALRSLAVVGLALVLAAAPLAALQPEPDPPCCCGSECYMACAKDAARRLSGTGGDHHHEAAATLQADRSCPDACSGLLAHAGTGGFLAGGSEADIEPVPSESSDPIPASPARRDSGVRSGPTPRGPPSP